MRLRRRGCAWDRDVQDLALQRLIRYDYFNEKLMQILCIIVAFTLSLGSNRFQEGVSESAAAAAPARSPEAAVLLAGLESYERSVGALEWEQWLYSPSHPERAWWLLDYRASGQGERGEWYVLSEGHSLSREKGGEQTARSYWFGLPADPRAFAVNLESGRGKAAGPDFDRRYYASPQHFFGRYLDFGLSRRLFELLAGAEELTAHPPSAGEPWPMLSGSLVIAGIPSGLEVRIDPEHGFSPRHIRWIRQDLGTVVEHLEVVTYTRLDGVWLPEWGVRTLYSVFDPADEPETVRALAEREVLRARINALHGLEHVDETAAAALTEAVSRHCRFGACGEDGEWLLIPLGSADDDGPDSPNVVFMRYRSINRPISPERLAYPALESASIFDFFRGRRVPPEAAVAPLALEPVHEEPARPATIEGGGR